MKRYSRPVSWFVFVLFCVVSVMTASDLQRGITFSPTEHITNTKLHNLVDETTINTTFFTDKAAAQPTASDVFLFVQPGTPIYRKTTYATAFLSNTNIIVGQSENDLPVTNDFFLMFDSSAGSLVKTPLISIFTNAAGSISAFPDYTNVPAGGFSYWYGYQGNGGRIEHSNLFSGFWQWMNVDTNIAAVNPLTNSILGSYHTTPTNADVIMIWDKLHQTNKFTTLVGLLTNLPAVSPGLTNGDTFQMLSTRTNALNPFGTNAVLSKVTLADLFTNYPSIPLFAGSPTSDQTSRVTSADTIMIWSTSTNIGFGATNFPAKVPLARIVQRFITNGIPVTAGLAADGHHGIGGVFNGSRPQVVKWYLVETNAAGSAGYSQYDKIPLECTELASGGPVAGAGGANYTNVFCTMRTATPFVPTKGATGVTQIVAADWNLECVAEFWPYY